ncbi:Gfo/Idh/MocA family oxidoreductase [Occultella glacieicola]|uniref:Gfo/Idh/MocA family oxidoreductase n=1 Tax=Occultella glacieicola TaxID=2518684 RepID=UPI001404FA2B|nr:Gfo/Idh/MocA family oxidoreductase [Occultella glacieicola]
MTARIGLVGLETSHPGSFVPLLRDLGHEVSVVLDPGELRGAAHAARFAREHGVARVGRDLEDVAGNCDVAILLGTDWDRHLAQVTSLRAAGVAVLVDKPVAGSAGDLRALAAAAAAGERGEGPPVTGGSSLRTAPEARAWRGRGQRALSVRTGCTGHPLYYGVHATSLAVGLLGDGLVAARATGTDPGVLAGELRHADGATIVVEVPRRPVGAPFRAEVRTAVGGVDVIEPAGAGLYRPFLAVCLEHLTGRGPAPAGPRGLVEPELAVLAIAWSAAADTPGAWVDLDEVPDEWQPWAGAAFTGEYRPR